MTSNIDLSSIGKIVNRTLKLNKNIDNIIKEIHPDVNVRYNSVNVIVGKQCLGN